MEIKQVIEAFQLEPLRICNLLEQIMVERVLEWLNLSRIQWGWDGKNDNGDIQASGIYVYQ